MEYHRLTINHRETGEDAYAYCFQDAPLIDALPEMGAWRVRGKELEIFYEAGSGGRTVKRIGRRGAMTVYVVARNVTNFYLSVEEVEAPE